MRHQNNPVPSAAWLSACWRALQSLRPQRRRDAAPSRPRGVRSHGGGGRKLPRINDVLARAGREPRAPE